MHEYIYLIHPFRESFYSAPTAEEETVMDEHHEYLKQAAEAGTVILAGPCLDETFGIVVIQATDDIKAKTFMLNDPAVKKNIMVAELHPLRISLRGK